MGIFEHLDIMMMILVPLLTCAFAFGGAAFVFKNNVKILEEFRQFIDKISTKIEHMESYYIKDMKNVMTKPMCEEETAHCIKSRDKVRDSLEKTIDELQASLNTQDDKRHETNNKMHACWLEIHEKLATIMANQESNKAMFSIHDLVLRERSGHTDRINALEKALKLRANSAMISMPFGRRATDKKEEAA